MQGHIYEPVVRCLKDLGFDTKFSPLDNITVNNKKVSGYAQTSRNNVLLQHRTNLLDIDFRQDVRDVKERVMGLKMHFDELAIQHWQSFGRSFQAEVFSANPKRSQRL
jgi:lipoate-protein ligase A